MTEKNGESKVTVIDKRGVEDPPPPPPPPPPAEETAGFIYTRGLNPMLEENEITPVGGCVLVKAIMPPTSGPGLVAPGNIDTRRAVAFEVRAVAADVPPGVIAVGQHLYHVSASVEPVSNDASSPWFAIHWLDIRMKWWPPGSKWERYEKDIEQLMQVTGEYPVRAEHEGPGWSILDNAGDVLTRGMTETQARRGADDMNRLHAERQPFALTVPASQNTKAQAPGPQIVKEDLASLFRGLGEREMAIVDRVRATAGYEEALLLSDELRGMGLSEEIEEAVQDVQQQPRQVPMVPREQRMVVNNPEPQQQGGAVGVFIVGDPNPIRTFATADEAMEYGNTHAPPNLHWTIGPAPQGPPRRPKQPPRFEPPEQDGRTHTFFGPPGMAGRAAPARTAGPVGPGSPRPPPAGGGNRRFSSRMG